jgi:hypothetical protein
VRRVPVRVGVSIFAVALLISVLIPVQAQDARPYRILVTNDDGVRAPGLAALIDALAPIGEITIVAPAENQSGTGHALRNQTGVRGGAPLNHGAFMV